MDNVATTPRTDVQHPMHLWLGLQRAVHRACPLWLRHRREDLTQDAFLRAMEMTRRRQTRMDLSPSYLRRVAYSTVVDEIRKIRIRQENVPNSIDSSPWDDAISTKQTTATPEQDFAARELGAAILKCLADVSEARRKAIVLYLQGHSLSEVARSLEWTRKRTENLIYRGLASLRSNLASKGFTY